MTRNLRVLASFLLLLLVGNCRTVEALEHNTEGPFLLCPTLQPALETIGNEMEARIKTFVGELLKDLEAKMSLIELPLNDQIQDVATPLLRQEVTADFDEEEVMKSTCGLMSSEWQSHLSGFASLLNKTLTDLENKRNSCSFDIKTMFSWYLTVNETLFELVEQWTNWTLQNSCKEGWHYFEGSCYFFSFNTASWTEGRQECLGMEADYTKVTSSEEWNFIASHITNNSWVGLNDLQDEGTFRWISDGSEEGKNSWWHENEPNNYDGIEHCVQYKFQGGKLLWNDFDCFFKNSFICEMSLIE